MAAIPPPPGKSTTGKVGGPAASGRHARSGPTRRKVIFGVGSAAVAFGLGATVGDNVLEKVIDALDGGSTPQTPRTQRGGTVQIGNAKIPWISTVARTRSGLAVALVFPEKPLPDNNILFVGGFVAPEVSVPKGKPLPSYVDPRTALVDPTTGTTWSANHRFPGGIVYKDVNGAPSGRALELQVFAAPANSTPASWTSLDPERFSTGRIILAHADPSDDRTRVDGIQFDTALWMQTHDGNLYTEFERYDLSSVPLNTDVRRLLHLEKSAPELPINTL